MDNISLEEAANAFVTPELLYDEMTHGYEIGYPDGFKAGAQWQKEQTKTKRVWVNLIDGKFSNSWQTGGIYDIKYSNWEEEIIEAAKRGWKLIEYTCVNDPDFELYNQMKLR